MTASNSKKRPESNRVFALRRYLIAFFFLVIFVLLDRTTVYLQIVPGISAWYPPVGIALALLIGMGPRYAPLYWLAGFISAKVNYHQPSLSYIFLPGNSLDFGTYTLIAIVLRRIFKMDWRLTSIRDVMVLLFVALPLSGVAAFLATLTLILDHVIPWSAYVKASLDWWVGDEVAIACLTPFCLVLVMPVVRRFAGLAQTAADMESASAGKRFHEAQGFRRAIESVCFGGAIVGSLWLALGPRSSGNQNMF
jgi:integral membrane sensor domain MASE1